ALGDLAPPEFVRFLQAVVRRGRQGLVGEIVQQYHALVDVKLNRVHAGVTLLDAPDARLEQAVVERLSRAIGKEVRAHFRADRGILGGVVVRVGDRIYDGSVIRSPTRTTTRSEEHTSELQSLAYLVCRLLLEKKKKKHPI